MNVNQFPMQACTEHISFSICLYFIVIHDEINTLLLRLLRHISVNTNGNWVCACCHSNGQGVSG